MLFYSLLRAPPKETKQFVSGEEILPSPSAGLPSIQALGSPPHLGPTQHQAGPTTPSGTEHPTKPSCDRTSHCHGHCIVH